jgi:hypothetical protein
MIEDARLKFVLIDDRMHAIGLIIIDVKQLFSLK